MSKKSKRKQSEKEKQNEVVERILVQMIDTPFEDFKNDVETQELSLGLTQTACVYLKLQFSRVAHAKDDMLQALENNMLSLEDEEVSKNMENLYLTLQNIEAKINYLSERANRLMNEV